MKKGLKVTSIAAMSASLAVPALVVPTAHIEAATIAPGIYNVKESAYVSIPLFKRLTISQRIDVLLHPNSYLVTGTTGLDTMDIFTLSNRELQSAGTPIESLEAAHSVDFANLASIAPTEESVKAIQITGDTVNENGTAKFKVKANTSKAVDLNAKGKDANDILIKLYQPVVKWSSSDTSVATINTKGEVSTKSVTADKEVTITAEAYGKKQTIKLTVSKEASQVKAGSLKVKDADKLDSDSERDGIQIALDGNGTVDGESNGSIGITFTAYDQYGEMAPNVSISSADPSIAEAVKDNGNNKVKINAKKAGDTTVTAIFGADRVVLNVKVTDAALQGGSNKVPAEILSVGTYGPESGSETINGNVVIKSKDVKLRNVVINGDLTIDKAVGEGEVRLDNVKVTGNTYVKGGGENSVYFNNSVLATVIVNKNTGAVRIVAQGDTEVYEVQLETPTHVVEQGLTGGAAGFADITIAEAMQGSGNAQVQLDGTFETINSRASNIRINLGDSTDIRTLVLNAAATVLGGRAIDTARINANGSTISQRPQNVVLNINGSVTINGEEIEESYSDNTNAGVLTGIKASQGSINVNLDHFVGGLSASDFKVTAKVDGQVYNLRNVSYKSSEQRITFSPIELDNNIGKSAQITVEPNSNKIAGTAKTDTFQIGTGFGGRITDIQGVGIKNLTIDFRSGSGAKTGPIVGSAKTDNNGYYTINLPAGVYTGEFSAPGYVTTYTLGTAATDVFLTDQNETAIRAAGSNELKIMLTWGKDPHDLDSHLTGPSIDGGQFHIAYYNKEEAVDGVQYADLDWDDVDSYGPETTTIRKLIDGDYRFFIHNFSGEYPMSLSGAKVEFFTGNSKTPNQTFTVPEGSGQERYWVVFDLKVSNNGETIRVEPVNKLYNKEIAKLLINGKDFSEEDEGYVGENSIAEFKADTPGATIYYTTDGAEPTLDSPKYTGPIRVTKTTEFNTMTVKDGLILGYGYHYVQVLNLESLAVEIGNLEDYFNDGYQDEEDIYWLTEDYERVNGLLAQLPDSPEKTGLLNRLLIIKSQIDQLK